MVLFEKQEKRKKECERERRHSLTELDPRDRGLVVGGGERGNTRSDGQSSIWVNPVLGTSGRQEENEQDLVF